MFPAVRQMMRPGDPRLLPMIELQLHVSMRGCHCGKRQFNRLIEFWLERCVNDP